MFHRLFYSWWPWMYVLRWLWLCRRSRWIFFHVFFLNLNIICWCCVSVNFLCKCISDGCERVSVYVKIKSINKAAITIMYFGKIQKNCYRCLQYKYRIAKVYGRVFIVEGNMHFGYMLSNWKLFWEKFTGLEIFLNLLIY